MGVGGGLKETSGLLLWGTSCVHHTPMASRVLRDLRHPTIGRISWWRLLSAFVSAWAQTNRIIIMVVGMSVSISINISATIVFSTNISKHISITISMCIGTITSTSAPTCSMVSLTICGVWHAWCEIRSLPRLWSQYVAYDIDKHVVHLYHVHCL